MIARKEAQRLLEEFLARERGVREGSREAPTYGDLQDIAKAVLADSDLVLRGAENVEQKARRYLTEGRVTVEKITPAGLIVAHARGSAGEPYPLGYDPGPKQWRCTCGPAGRKGRCSHVIALKLITSPTTTGGT